jgi:5-methylcytosine-specific restriction endonuclease McrA
MTKARRISKNGKHHTKGGKWASKRTRLAIFLRDGGMCLFCLKDLHHTHPGDVTLDHLIPRSAGGTDDPTNLVNCCRSCNSKKQDRPLDRFAGPETIKHIRRNTRRSMVKYLKLADAFLAGKTGAGSD